MLRASQPVPGIAWLQTRCARPARRLLKRRDGRFVMTRVSGGYLRTMEFSQPLAWAKPLANGFLLDAWTSMP
jgi:hypothetical protein